MKTVRVLCACFFLLSSCTGYAQDQATLKVSAQQQAPEAAAARSVRLSRDVLEETEKVTLDFKDADIRNILKIIAQKSGINIVPTPEVMGTVTIKLVDVPWERAMDIILKSNGYGYQKQGNVILVTKIENMAKIQSEEPLRTEIINLRFLDAQDAQRILIPMLSTRGKIAILYTRGQKGWKFGTFKIGQETVAARALERESEGAPRQEPIAIEKTPTGGTITSKIETEPSIKSKTIIVTDTDSILDRIVNVVLPQIDKKPKQVLIEARIMEVNVDKLRDFGIDYLTGTTGVPTAVPFRKNSQDGSSLADVQGSMYGALVQPSNFGPKASLSGVDYFDSGLELVFRKLTGTELYFVLHALEENVNANTLSCPRILTLDNQEAAMLVGYHTPILQSTVADDDDSGVTVTQTLSYYQEIGIRLNVVPQVSEDGYINMIIHPSVTSSTSSVDAYSTAGNTTITTRYPIIDTREVQTQILLKDGETVVISGLRKEIKSKGYIGVPFLSSIPIIGALFRRQTNDTSKIDLLIFLTARVVKDDEFSAEEITRLEENMMGVMKKQPLEEKKKKKKSKK